MGLALTFILFVLTPLGLSAAYLWLRAENQYASFTAFSVRQEDVASGLTGLLGGIMQMSGTSSRDTDILHEFIRSQDLVARLSERLDLPAIWSRPGTDLWTGDPVFAFDPSGTIEDLTRHWQRMVRVDYDQGSGLIEVRVLAFQPEDATTIAQAILDESSVLINSLATVAREDTMRVAQFELDRAEQRLRDIRAEVTSFRSRTRIVDPTADIQGQMGLLNTLQAQLATALIDLDLLRETTRSTDPRVVQAERRIAVIRNRIEEERSRFALGGEGPSGDDFTTLVAEFERLTVDREFAETAYRAALASYDTALAEAQRQNRYLAAFVPPTRAQRAEYPERFTIFGLMALFLSFGWGAAAVVYFSIRDRR